MARRRPQPARSRRRPRHLAVEGLECRRLLAANVVVGSDAGAGSSPLVRLIDAETGDVRASVMAFEPGFRGGVRLAMGRLTGNAAADVVVASGAGRPAEVRVFRPVTSGSTTTLQQVLAFNPFGAAYRGGLDVAVGDVDGDTTEEIIVSQSRDGGDVRVFRMTNPGGTLTRSLLASIAKPFGPGYRGGSSVGVADVGEFSNGGLVKSVGDNKVEILVGSGVGIPARVLVYDVSRPAAPRVADTIRPSLAASFLGGVSVAGGRYASNGVADSIDKIFVSAGRGGASQIFIYDGTVGPAANQLVRSFAPYASLARPNAAVFTAPVDVDGNGQVDRFLAGQGDPGGPAGLSNISNLGVRAATAITSLPGPLRVAAARTVFQPQTITGTVTTPSPTAGVAAGATRNMEIREIVTGSGPVASTWDKVTVQYTGMLTNGTVFDTSRQAGREPFQLTLGAGQVIAGWEAGLVGMKAGGRRLLVIPPELAYGDATRTNIPAKSTLVFDVELVAVTANRPATISGTSTGALTEDGTPTSVGGTLTVTDPDHSIGPPPNVQNGFQTPASLAGTYGAFTFDPDTGVWGYTLDNARPATQALTAGQIVTDTLTVTSIDGTASRAITVTVTGAGEIPTNIALSAATVAENVAAGTAIGTLSTTDTDSVAPFTYALVAGDGATDNGSFTIDGAVLKTAAAVDFETKSSYSVRVRSTDANGLSVEKAFTIAVTNVDEAPTDVSLSASSVAENAAAGTAVGTLSSTDADAGGSFTYTLVTGAGDTDNASFTIDGAVLKTAAVFDRETQASRSVRVRSTDQTGLWFEKALTITITNVNEAPTDVALSAAVVADGAGSGTAVGTLSTTDVDAGDTFTYTFVSGDGDTDNASFTIDGAVLKTAAAFDFETKSSYSIRVRSTDSGGLSVEKAFTVTVSNVNEPPSDIALSAATVAENAAAGTAVGTLSTTDVDPGDSFTYTLVSGAGDTDNVSFTIDGAVLKTAAAFDFETKSSYAIRVRSTDANGLSFEKQFTITVTDANDVASISGTSTASINADGPTTTAGGTLTVGDQDAGEGVFATPAALAGIYGTFTFDTATGAWTYSLATSVLATVILTSDQTVTDTLTVTSVDGTDSETITVSVTGYTMQTASGIVNTPSPSAAVPAGSTRTIRYRDFSTGTGDVATAGKVIDAYYIGLLSDGTIFQALWPQGPSVPAPLRSTLSTGSLIPGWVYGLEGMKVGGVRVLVIPPELAYGDDGGGPGSGIPGDATLTFVVSLEGVSDPAAP